MIIWPISPGRRARRGCGHGARLKPGRTLTVTESDLRKPRAATARTPESGRRTVSLLAPSHRARRVTVPGPGGAGAPLAGPLRVPGRGTGTVELRRGHRPGPGAEGATDSSRASRGPGAARPGGGGPGAGSLEPGVRSPGPVILTAVGSSS
eukprot:755450-Hanusia_phi.AAC.1